MTVFVPVLATLLLVACGGPERGPLRQAYGHEKPVYGGDVVFADDDDIRTLDPAIGYDETSWVGEHLVFDTLLAYDDDVRLIPSLATSYDVSDDGLTWTFHLRQGVKFHNGREMTADDVVYSWNRLFDPRLASPAIDFYNVIVGADDVLDGKADHLSGLTAPDRYTVQARIVAPQASFANIVAMQFGSVIPKEAVEARGDQWPFAPVGTGPFEVKQGDWTLGEKTVFTRNADYWEKDADGRPYPYLDRVVHLAHHNEALQFLKIEADELTQQNRITSPDYLWVRENPKWKPYVDEIPQIDAYAELMNTELAPFDDVWFRRAVSCAIDRDKLKRLRNGRLMPSSSWIPPQLPGYEEGLPYQTYDPKLAKECLQKSKYPDWSEPIPYYTLTQESSIITAQSIQQDLDAIGIHIAIQNVTFPAYLEAIGTRKRVPMAYGAWVIDYPDTENFMEPKFLCDHRADSNSNNDAFYCNPEYDKLVLQAKGELDPAKRADLYSQAQRILAADAPYAFEYHSVQVNVRQPYLKGARLHPVYTRDFRYAWLDLPEGRETP